MNWVSFSESKAWHIEKPDHTTGCGVSFDVPIARRINYRQPEENEVKHLGKCQACFDEEFGPERLEVGVAYILFGFNLHFGIWLANDHFAGVRERAGAEWLAQERHCNFPSGTAAPIARWCKYPHEDLNPQHVRDGKYWENKEMFRWLKENQTYGS